VLGDSSLHVRILDKVPTTAEEEALRIVLNLEALDHSWDVEVEVMAEHQECTTEEVTRKEKYARVAAEPVSGPAVELATASAVPAFADIKQLCDTLAHCTQQMVRMHWDVMHLTQSLTVLALYVTSYPSSVPCGGTYTVPLPSYSSGSFGQQPPQPSMLLPGMTPVVMPALQLIDYTGRATAALGPIPTIVWSSGPCQNGPPTGPCEKEVVPPLALTTGVVPDMYSKSPVSRKRVIYNVPHLHNRGASPAKGRFYSADY